MQSVILLSHGFQSEYEIGFANGLSRIGMDVTLIGSDNTFRDRAVAGLTIVNLRGSQDSRRPALAKAANLLRYVLLYLVHIRRNRQKPVHVIGLFSTGNVLLALAEAWLTRLMAGPFVLTVHDVLPHDRHTRFNRLVYRLIYKAPGQFVLHSTRAAQRLAAEFSVPASRIAVVEHGIDRFLAPEPALGTEWKQQRNIPVDVPIALFFGKIMQYKGVDILLDAFELAGRDAELHCVIAGLCPSRQLRDALRQQIDAHPFRERIHWLDGFIADEHIPALLAAADFLVMPYRHIDQSGVLFMALSAGLPLLVTDVGVLADYVGPAIGLVVPPEDAQALASAMLRFVRESGIANRDSILARARGLQWSSTLEKLSITYSRVQEAQ